jgi:hypothetical protein
LPVSSWMRLVCCYNDDASCSAGSRYRLNGSINVILTRRGSLSITSRRKTDDKATQLGLCPALNPSINHSSILAMEEDTTNHAAVRFRPSKNRKAYRQRDADVDTTQNDEESPLTHIRATRKARPRGVAFGAPPPSDSQALVPAAEDRPAKGIPDRFMHQTGMVATLNDKHMYVVRGVSESRASNANHSGTNI